MRRTVLLPALAILVVPAVASASSETTPASTPELELRVERISVQPDSVYLARFTERLAGRRDQTRRAFEDAKRRRLFFTSATAWEKRLWDKTKALSRRTYPEVATSEPEAAITATN